MPTDDTADSIDTSSERRIDLAPGEVNASNYPGDHVVIVRAIDGRNTTLAVHDRF